MWPQVRINASPLRASMIVPEPHEWPLGSSIRRRTVAATSPASRGESVGDAAALGPTCGMPPGSSAGGEGRFPAGSTLVATGITTGTAGVVGGGAAWVAAITAPAALDPSG